jgi:hypothetical protein
LRTRHNQVVGGQRGRRIAGKLGALCLPASLQHPRQPMDDDVEEAPDQQAGDAGEDQRDSRR